MFNSTMPRSAAVVLLGLASLSACGDDDVSGSDTGDPVAAAEAVDVVDDSNTADDDAADGDASDAGEGEAGDDPGSNDGDDGSSVVSDSTKLRAVAAAFETTYKAERVEVDGDTVHIHPGDSPLLRYGVECDLARMMFPDGATLVIHRDGEATPCE